ncbi:MAG: hypothetical protein QM767_04440 [Anaeromyxobacter sp.]
MLEVHHRPAAETPATLARRARSWLGLPADRPPPRPRPARIDPLRRSWLAAFWQARLSVAAGVTLDDYLRSRLARYLAALPVARERLGLELGVVDGELRVSVAPPSPPAAADAGPDAWLAPLAAAEGPAVREEVHALEVRLAALEAESDEARQRAEALERRLAADVACGALSGPPIEATAEQLGRPPGRSALSEAVLLTLAGAGLAATTWQVALPLLRAAGLDPHRLRAELAARPPEVIFTLLFALGVAAGLFTLVHAALRAAGALAAAPAEPRRRGWLGAALASAVVLIALVAAAVVALPGEGPAVPAWAAVLLLCVVPVGASLLVHAATGDRERRHAALAAALAWDRQRAGALAERARRLEELEWAEEERRDLELDRELTRRRLRDVAARALVVARRAAEAGRREQASLARLAQSLLAALELDRYEFIRQASARGLLELLGPSRRAVGDMRAAGAPAAAQPRPAEAGRLAS